MWKGESFKKLKLMSQKVKYFKLYFILYFNEYGSYSYSEVLQYFEICFLNLNFFWRQIRAHVELSFKWGEGAERKKQSYWGRTDGENQTQMERCD